MRGRSVRSLIIAEEEDTETGDAVDEDEKTPFAVSMRHVPLRHAWWSGHHVEGGVA